MDDDIQEKIGQIQLMQQNIQNFSAQRQQFQMQQTELEAALSELDKTTQAYRIIGNIMVLTDKDSLRKELEEKKGMLTVRIASIERQEAKIREKAETIQKEVLQEIEKNKESKPKTRRPSAQQNDSQ